MDTASFSTGLRDSLRSAYAAPLVRAVPVAATLAAASSIAWNDRGSIASGDFTPVAVLVALMAAAVLGSGVARRPPREALVTGGALVALAIWAAVSGWWAPVPSLARDEGLLVAFGLLAFLVPVLTLREPFDRLAALGVVAGGLGVVAVASAIHLAGSSSMFDVFRYRRLSFPITYANACAGFFLAGFWPAVLLGSRRGASPWARVPALAAAALLLGTSVLAQSKGAVLGLVVSLLAVAAFAPARLRILLGCLLALVPVAVAFPVLIAPYRAGTAETHDVHRAALALLVVAAAGAVLGAGWTAADRRIELRTETRRLIGRVVAAAAVLAVVAGLGAFVAVEHHPGAWLAARWQSFKHPSSTSSATHLVELGSNRYDFWRVAVHEWRAHPLVGGGARSFGPYYLVHGRSSEEPARAHSLPLELLGEEGIVGFLIALLAYGALLVGLARRARRRSVAATAAFAGCVLLLTQALSDWTFTFPALTVPFFLLGGIGLSDDGRRRLGPRPQRAATVVAILAAIFAFAPVWLSVKLVHRGVAERSVSDLRWAHRLDPVTVDPWIAEAEIAPDARAAIPPMLAAERREPDAIAVHYVLGSVYYNAGRKRAALHEFQRALQLHPGDDAVTRALAVVRQSLKK